MATAVRPVPRRIRFGPYEFEPDSQLLSKHGLRLKLQGKPLQLLAALVERPGQTVGREELQRRLWPADTFVDFETGLNTAAKRLRAALSDSADQPVYVETLARSGYRFIAPVEVFEQTLPEPAPADEPVVVASPVRARRSTWGWLAFGLAAAGAAASFLAARAPQEKAPVTFRQLTFGRGPVFGAAFGPDGHSVLFSAQWDPDKPRQIFLNSGTGPESRALGFAGHSIAAVSAHGELALMRSGGTLPIAGGELFKVPMSGGVPVAVDKAIMSAGWSPDGLQLAMVRASGGRNALEFPAGKVLHSTAGWLSHIRFSPDGQHVVFLDHPTRHDDAGSVLVTDLAGRVTTLTKPWASVRGVAWRDDREVWFSASESSAPASLWSVTLSGVTRPLAQFPVAIGLRDISANGSALLSRDSRRLESVALMPGGVERNLSHFDWTRAVEIDNRGRVLFDESGEAVGSRSVAFLSSVDGVARLGEGIAMGFSPDGESALLLDNSDRALLRLVPLEGGSPVEIQRSGLSYQWARFFPDGRRLLALASESASNGSPLRLWEVSLEKGTRHALTGPEMVRHAAISPDGRSVVFLNAKGRLMTLEGDGEQPRELLADAAEPLAPVQFSPGGFVLYVQHLARSGPPAQVSRLDLRTGQLTPWKRFSPADRAGVDSVTRVLVSPDARAQVFTVRRIHSELFLATGIR